MTTLDDSFDLASGLPAVLSSRPGSASHSGGPPSPSPSEPSNNTFDPSLYLNPSSLPPMPNFDLSSLSNDDTTTIEGMLGSVDVGGGGPLGGGAAPSGSSVPPMIQFNPSKGSPSDDEDDGADARRPKKRKSVANLRSAASSSAAPADDDDDDDAEKGRRKIMIEYIEEKSKRHITFSKRKAGIMKKAYELSTLTGTQVLLLVVSESGWVYTFTTDKFKPLVKEDENGQLSQGQKLIAACLEAKESSSELSAGPSYQPTAANNNFEANSAIHGGQIALKAGRHPGRPTITNRRVSSKGRHHIPTAIHTGQDQGGIPGIPQLPTPMTGYLDQPLHSPISPRGAPGSRGMSHPPQSPANRGMHQMQQQQAMGGPGQQNYAEMLQRAEMDHLHQQQYGGGGGSGGQGYDSMYGSSTSTSLPQHSMGMHAHHSDSYPPYDLPTPQSHYTHHPESSHQMSGQRNMFPQSSQSVYAHDDGQYAGR